MATRKFWITLLLALTVVVAGCSSGTDEGTDSDDDIATLADEETDSTTAAGDDGTETDDTETDNDGDETNGETVSGDESISTTTTVELEPEEAALQFSQCMRDEGIADFPDLGIDGSGNIDITDLPTDLGDDPEVQDALEVCQPLIEAGGFGERIREVVESPEFNDALIEFSDCIRDEGFDVGDLTLIGLAGAAFAAPDAGEANPQGGDREDGFGDRDGIFAEALGLDPDDPEVQAAVNTCLPKIEGAMADLGFAE